MWGNQEGYNSYGGGAGGADQQQGGYMNSPGFGSPSGTQGERKRQRAQNIIPCTVAQVLSAANVDDRFLADGIELHQILIVGLVRSVQETPTRLDYVIDDGTAQIDVKQFVDTDENDPDISRVKPMLENTYVRVAGNLRSFSGKKNMVAFKMMQVTDMNELTTHILEVMKSHIILGQAQEGSAGQQPMSVDYEAKQGNAYPGAQVDTISGLQPVQQQVQLVITSAQGEQGISIQEICMKLRGIPEKQIRDAVEFLSGEGHIYSTIDDDHFRSTDSM